MKIVHLNLCATHRGFTECTCSGKSQVDVIRWQLGSLLSMQPAPFEWSRNRIEDGNGNEVLLEDILEFVNFMVEKLPPLLDFADASIHLVAGRKMLDLYDSMANVSAALMALEDMELSSK